MIKGVVITIDNGVEVIEKYFKGLNPAEKYIDEYIQNEPIRRGEHSMVEVGVKVITHLYWLPTLKYIYRRHSGPSNLQCTMINLSMQMALEEGKKFSSNYMSKYILLHDFLVWMMEEFGDVNNLRPEVGLDYDPVV